MKKIILPKSRISKAKAIKIQSSIVRQNSSQLTNQLIDELVEGHKINLSDYYKEQSENVQKRVLRRIVEKRQAQMTHRLIGHSNNSYARQLTQHCANKSVNRINRCLGETIMQ